MIKEILNEINAIERFLKNHREYLGRSMPNIKPH
ncbi:MAG: hypothetical protein PWQ85_1264 [Geotoga sp.]|nr:hypothetical protein [Geotoga sp.]